MAASVAVHAVLLTAVALHAPRLKVPPEEPGLPEAVIPVLILPRAPPPTAAPGARPTPIRLHRRPQRFAEEPRHEAPPQRQEGKTAGESDSEDSRLAA